MGKHAENFSRREIFEARKPANHPKVLYLWAQDAGLHLLTVRTNCGLIANQNFKSTINSTRFAQFAPANFCRPLEAKPHSRSAWLGES
jgi:hypothetical protein